MLYGIDPPNDYLPDGQEGDNNGANLIFNGGASLTFYRNESSKVKVVTVGQKAGDNYKVKATDTSGNKVVTNNILTVWRRL